MGSLPGQMHVRGQTPAEKAKTRWRDTGKRVRSHTAYAEGVERRLLKWQLGRTIRLIAFLITRVVSKGRS